MRLAVSIIVGAQLLGTSLWFSANSAADDLARLWSLTPADIGWLTNAVQAGFIAGTLLFAFSGIADRYRASRIFVIACICGAIFNALFALFSDSLQSAMWLRFGVGMALAGIYPLGMKLIVGWNPGSAGRSLGLLVGMLTLGTALPHGLRGVGASLSWQVVVLSSSALALVAALMVALLGDGPHLRQKAGAALQPGRNVLQAFRIPSLRASALGYFGHMWELYAFWTLVPLLVLAAIQGAGTSAATATASATATATAMTLTSSTATIVSLWAFAVIGIGGLGCMLGGLISLRIGSARVAWWALASSALCCLLYPFTTGWPLQIQLAFLLFWGVAAVADSPQFSAMSIKACPPAMVGSALTMQNSIGFFITTLSIFIATQAYPLLGAKVAWLLLPGPLLGLIGMRALLRQN